MPFKRKQPLIDGRVLNPFSVFYEECWFKLRDLLPSGAVPSAGQVDLARAREIGRELLLLSEFCDDWEQHALYGHFSLTAPRRIGYTTLYNRHVGRHLGKKGKSA